MPMKLMSKKIFHCINKIPFGKRNFQFFSTNDLKIEIDDPAQLNNDGDSKKEKILIFQHRIQNFYYEYHAITIKVTTSVIGIENMKLALLKGSLKNGWLNQKRC